MSKSDNNKNSLWAYFIFALQHPFLFVYNIWQICVNAILAPTPPGPKTHLGRPKIAVIGAGITGVSAAAHCVGHGFDVAIFEAGSEKNVGGIWSRVNNTSGLQIHSLMYRFFPSVQWTAGYPDRQQITSQVREIFRTYGLDKKVHFNTKVERVYQDDKGRWIINDPSYGRFDGVLPAIGSCGDPKMPSIKNSNNFKGEIHHSSQLDGKSAKGKKVAIIGGGASAVEALEFVTHTGAAHTSVLARSDKWIIPRNAIIDMLFAFNIFGMETIFSWIPETLLKIFFYRDLADIAPSGKGLFTQTPMVNSEVFDLIRDGKAEWLRGDILKMTENGVLFNHRAKNVPKGGPGREDEIEVDMVIMATGYERPSLSFLPKEVFTPPYSPPAWYLQVFPPGHYSICANNCTYVDAIGTVGNWHIGIYTRLLLVFLVDPLARPREYWAKRWIDMTMWIKERSPSGAFDFFTYAELIYWFVFCVAINPFRWKWALFVFCGIGEALPLDIIKREDKLRNGLGMRKAL